MTGKVIYNLLSTNSTIAGFVGTRIFPQRRLQETELPAITYNAVSNNPTNTKDGVSLLDTERWSINIFSKKYLNAADIAKEVRTELDRNSGTIQGVVVDSISFAGRADLYEDWSEVNHIVLDFNIRIKR
jgi:hypothetical protein